jgi:isopenicillin N synthase-like dioxygenase
MQHTPGQIPTLDLSTARSADGSFTPGFIDDLREAAHTVGFFHVINYGAAAGHAGPPGCP